MSERRDEILAACSSETQLDGVERSFIASFFDETLSAIKREFGIPAYQSPLPMSSDAAADLGARRQSSGLPITRLPSIFAAISQALGRVGQAYDLTISAEEYKLLNNCFDSGLATSIENYWRRDRDRESQVITEQYGFMAHELRNALGNANLAFKLIRANPLDMNGETADVLARSLRRMDALIAQCLSSVRLDASGPTELVPINVASVFRGVEASTILDRDVAIALHAEDSLLVLADEMLLASAINNLLHNAIKFSPPGATVQLRARAAGALALMEVTDECGGLGRDPAELFTPFVRRNKGNASGAGLGLSIAKRAIERMHGTLSVADDPGRGCTFTVALSLVPAPRT